MRAPRWLTASLAAGVLLVAGCHERPTVKKADAADTRHAVAPSVISAPGTVEAWSGETKLASIESGRLVELLVVEGQTVHAGDLVARLEDSQQRHAIAIAEAEVRQGNALVLGTSSTREELKIAEATARAATLRAEQQRRESERASALGAFGAVAGAEVERAEATLRIEEATRDAASLQLVAVKRGARWSDRELAAARRAAAEARLADARAALARREVRATSDGTVLWSRHHVGEFYAPGQGPLIVVGDDRHLQVRLEVDDGDAPLVPVDARVELRDDGGAPLGSGSVVRVAGMYGSRSVATERPTARTDARVREVFVEVDAPARVAPGQRVWGQIALGARHAAR